MKRKRSSPPAERRTPTPAPDPHDPGLTFTTHRVLLLLAAITILLKNPIFAPVSWWPLAFVCLVPWLLMVGGSTQAPRVYLYSLLMAFVFFLINMRWMAGVTIAGYVALALYQAAWFPLMACTLRHVVRRRRWPLAVWLPIIWTGQELLRAVVLSGFPWFFLSHSVYKVLPLIQISDIVGAYGVSFVIAAINGAVADELFAWFRRRREGTTTRRSPWRVSWMCPASLLVLSLLYGAVQLGRTTVSEGPKVAVIQGDYHMTVFDPGGGDLEKKRAYLEMMDEAAAQAPDVYVLPETPWSMYLNPEARDFFSISRRSFTDLQSRAARQNAYVITGSASLEPTPMDLLAPERRYNSAVVFHPDEREPDRYDKVHLVYFGEVVPFRFGRLRWLYLWMHKMMPFTGPDGIMEYSVFPGDGFHTYNMTPKSQPEKTYRFGIPICYEDVMPYVSRRFIGQGQSAKQADFLLNISNDGWFGRGHQQAQHLAICVFRAVENRVGIARSVNTGISGFVQPPGRLHDLVHPGPVPRDKDKRGFAVARLGVDSRFSLYTRYGDWFAIACTLVWLVVFVDYWVRRAKELA